MHPSEELAAPSDERKYGRITEDGLAELRKRMGKRHPIESPFIRYVNADSIRHVAHGIGDPNPLWTDPLHAAKSGFDKLPAPPALLYGCAWSAWDMRRGEGLPGVHGLHAGDVWTYYRPVVEGDYIHATRELVGVELRTGAYAGRSVMQRRRFDFLDQTEELVAQCEMRAIRTERDEGRSRGKYRDLKLGRYTPESIAEIESQYDAELTRGQSTRFWDGVSVGETMTPIVKGPLTVADMIAWMMGVGSPHIRSGKYWVAYRREHPRVAVRNPDTGIPEPVESVHWDRFLSSEIGMPAPYDYGAQRGAWATHFFTNWASDQGFLARLDVQYRSMTFLGDTLVFSGSVQRKWQGATAGYVECTVEAVNQRSERVLFGTGIVALPLEAGRRLIFPMDPAEVLAGVAAPA